MKKKLFRLNALLVAVTLQFSCATTPVYQEFPSNANASTEIETLNNQIKEARLKQLDVLAPISYKSAEASQTEAKNAIQKSTSSKEALRHIAIGLAYLRQAEKTAQVSIENMPGVVDARSAALIAGARTNKKDELETVDERLIRVTNLVEEGNTGRLYDNRKQLQLDYMNVEILAIKHEYLNPTVKQIALARTEGAEKYAPKTLATVEKKFEDVDSYITSNRTNLEAIQSQSTEVFSESEHLVDVTRKSKSNLNRTPEEATLEIEREEARTESARDSLNAQQKQNEVTSSQNAGLQNEKEFNQKFETARAQFNPNEAVVYRQGDRLIIRLKSLEFPVNQSVIRKKDLALLSKVSSMVKDFQNSTVVVEGHTDSAGGKQLNQKLSTERAETISKYLVSSQSLDASRITAEGHGSDSPLASNQTKIGRAQNRRVDIIISPVKL